MLSFVSSGALMTIAGSGRAGAEYLLLLSAPIIALLATALRWNNVRISQLGWYLGERIEKKLCKSVHPEAMGWDTGAWKAEWSRLDTKTGRVIRLGTKLHLRFIFIGLQTVFILAFFALVPISSISVGHAFLIAIDFLGVGYTVILFGEMGSMG
jgi:hypothetical protein